LTFIGELKCIGELEVQRSSYVSLTFIGELDFHRST